MADKFDRNELLHAVKKDLEWADTYYTDTVEPKLIERYEIYMASKDRYSRLYPKLSTKNSLRSFDMWSVIEWLIPSMMKAFFGSDTILSVNGMGPEDVARAELFEKWLQWQNTVKNKGYRIFKGWFRNAMIGNLGILKCWWHRDEEEQIKDEVLSTEQLAMLQTTPNIQILSVTPGPYVTFESWDVRWKETKLLRNHPVIETLRPCDFRFTPDGRVLEDCTLQAHRKVVTLDYLRREARKGIYPKRMIDDLAESAAESWVPTNLEILIDEAAEDSAGRMEGERSPKRRFTLNECFTKYDIDGDGELEDVIATICGEKLLRVVENPYGRTPFFPLVPFEDDNKVWSDIGLAEIVGDTQDANTAFFRQMIVALANSNESRGIVNTDFVNIEDLVSDAMFVRASGDAHGWFLPLQTSGINPQTFSLYEMFRGNLEQWTPMTRYNQGTDANTLNKTASGISMIMSASQQRQDEIIMNFAETGVADLIRFEIQLNQRYMDQPTHFRLSNNYLEITPDDIQGEFDLSVNGTTGIADRAAKNQALTGYLKEMYPAAEARGLAGPEQFVRAGRRLLKLNGLEDGDEYLIMPAPAPAMDPGGMGNGGLAVGGGAVPDSSGMPAGLPGGGGAEGINPAALPVLPGGGMGAPV